MRCLDEFEGLLVLERLHNDRARLRESWAFEISELGAMADVSGVHMAAF